MLSRIAVAMALLAASRSDAARSTRSGQAPRHAVQRLALPPDQLHPAGHRRPPRSCASWARASAARRCSASRCSSSGRYANSGDFAPTYYLQTDAPLYYYSFTDAYIASVYRALPQAEQARFDPMITGFNPADMYGVDHIRRVLKTFPGVFTGIGEFSIHKEFVSVEDRRRDRQPDQSRRSIASSTSPPSPGLVVILHNDIDMPFAKTDAEPVYLAQMKALLRRHPKTSIIWAHLGLGRIVHPVQVSADAAERSPSQMQIVEAMLTDPELAPRRASTSRGTRSRSTPSPRRSRSSGSSSVLNRYPDRFLFGTDTVAPAGPGAVLRRLRPVGAGVAAPHARGEPQGSQGQLRTDLRRGTAKGPGVGAGPRPMTFMNEGEMSMRLQRCTRLARNALAGWHCSSPSACRASAARAGSATDATNHCRR